MPAAANGLLWRAVPFLMMPNRACVVVTIAMTPPRGQTLMQGPAHGEGVLVDLWMIILGVPTAIWAGIVAIVPHATLFYLPELRD